MAPKENQRDGAKPFGPVECREEITTMTTSIEQTTPLPICKFPIELKALKALALLASKDETRYVLNGVAVSREGGSIFVVATDGRRLGVIRCIATDEHEFTETRPLIIPLDLIKRAPKPIVGHEVTISSDGKLITITNHIDTVVGKGIEGNYPNWKHVIPDGPVCAPRRIAFNPEQMRGFFDVGKVLVGYKTSFLLEQIAPTDNQNHEGFWSSPFILRISGLNEFFGILMPLSTSREDIEFIPGWVSALKEVKNA